ncbi:Serine/threonine-protein kinase [Corynebacterium pseudotuberculosis]|uniref:Stk1 family PASTA domain-containing Ser/Thr kinase n=1 Tax=Corynebacterium pseudotuberculosis TaxID=1719 RepID=UPI000CDCC80A|nr:Stk1 family PASTA domain-containing Ser/Thr kinase [Corynebacterium pseudotuberculosis]AUZ41965.1 Serine/threonine-protein kinase [Corynebacterium pseudotuberculosis]
MNDVIAGRYELGEVIGTGGMSEVYSATDTLLGREVAIKMLRADLARDVNFRERFRREAQNSGKLNHPAIVAVYDTGETERGGISTPYIVMERVHGRTLRDIVREDGPLSPTEAAQTLLPVCQALQFSHDAGIIHRDIKPANVMITNTGAVKIMDFGIARALDDATSAMTQTSAVIGTAQYLSPEQARGKLADARSDVYALGCVLYETLTGRPPFEGETPFAVAYQHVQEDPAKPSEFVSDLTPTAAVNVDAVVLTAMAKHPGDRYQTAMEMGADLERLARHAVTEAARHYVSPASLISQEPNPTTIVPVTQLDQPEADPVTSRAERAGYERSAFAGPAHAAEEDRSGMSKAMKAVLAVLAVLVLGVGGAFAYDYVSNSSKNRSLVNIPKLEKTSQQDAVNQLEQLGLQVNVIEEANPEVPRGKVIRTNPTSGSSVQKNTTVTVIVSSGKEVTEVPDLARKNTADAAKILEEAGLQLDSTVREESSDSVPNGEIIEQTPSAGSQVSRGSKVVITVSTGVQNVRVPVVTGMKWDQAEGNLTSLGFVPDVRTVDAPEPAGTVVAVSGEGTEVPKGSTITVKVSNGQMFNVPNITRLTVADAVRALNAAGWTGTASKLTQGERVPTVSLSDQNLIASQVPAAGTPLRKDSPIEIHLYEFSLSALTGTR